MRAFRRKAAKSTTFREYRDREIKLADLVDWAKPLIMDALFENCQIHGPAVIAPDSATSFRDCGFKFEKSSDEILWEVAPNSVKSGCIAIENCKFRGCTFSSIGLTGGPKLIEQFRKIAGAAE